jgi:hypothetical protein
MVLWKVMARVTGPGYFVGRLKDAAGRERENGAAK